MEVPLTQGKIALIDDEDWPLVAGFKWYAHKERNTFYVWATRHQVKVRMHRIILSPPKGTVVDHINGDGLDNRRCNIRLCTRTENMHNLPIYSNNKSGFKGVYLDRGRWRAMIGLGGKCRHVALCDTAEQAARAYDAAARELHGEFARLNFP